jgi:hypothetical protein
LSRRIVWYRRRRGCKSEQAHPGCSRRSRSTNGATERDVAWRAGTESYRLGRMNQADKGIRQRDCGHAVPPSRSGRGAGSRVAPCQMPWRARRCAMPGGRAKPVLPSCRFLPHGRQASPIGAIWRCPVALRSQFSRPLLAVVVRAIAISITSCTSGWNRRLPGMGEAGIFPSSEMQRAATALLDRWHKPERAARPVICYSWRVSLRLSQGRR